MLPFVILALALFVGAWMLYTRRKDIVWDIATLIIAFTAVYFIYLSFSYYLIGEGVKANWSGGLGVLGITNTTGMSGNLALNATCDQSSNSSSNGCRQAFDGNTSSFWNATSGTTEEWLVVRFNGSKLINRIGILNGQASYRVDTLNITLTGAVPYTTTLKLYNSSTDTRYLYFDTPVMAEQVILTVDGILTGVQLNEVEVFEVPHTSGFGWADPSVAEYLAVFSSNLSIVEIIGAALPSLWIFGALLAFYLAVDTWWFGRNKR
jgi:hypothetical protein